MTHPDPFREIRLLSLRSLGGANFWSRYPVTRLDMVVGAYDDLSSAEVDGVTEALQRALPGLVEHRCSVGERGGFLTRLRRGTYVPHITEHVALELQSLAGHDVGYGRARGGDNPGEYTVVIEHLHSRVGARAAALALETVQRAFAGTLTDVAAAAAELRALAAVPEPAPEEREVACAITGGGDLAAVRCELQRRVGAAGGTVLEVLPLTMLRTGLPYARSETAVILDAAPHDVPERYRDPELAQRLVSVVADAVPRGGIVVVPAREREVQELVLDARRRVAVFGDGAELSRGDTRLAHAVAVVRAGRVVCEIQGVGRCDEALRPGVPAAAQAAAALAALVLEETREERNERNATGA